MNSENIDMCAMIEKLEDILGRLDDNSFALAAIKIEEAIRALTQIESEALGARDGDT